MAAPETLRYVRACQECEWHLHVWPQGEPEKARRIPYRCRSWRHKGECREWKGAQDFQRCREAVAKRDDWTYIVLTYAQAKWESPHQLFRAGVRHWSAVRKRWTRRYGPLAYIQTWEIHKTGWPHCNVLVGNENMFAEAMDHWRALRKEIVMPDVVACGFGEIVWVEPVNDHDYMTRYLTNLAKELTGANKKDQTPVNAPPHFRRLRASRGLLPPPHKNPDITGRLVFGPIERFLPECKRVAVPAIAQAEERDVALT